MSQELVFVCLCGEHIIVVCMSACVSVPSYVKPYLYFVGNV